MGGRGKDEGVRGRTRLTGPSESQSETWLPSPAPRREVRGGAGVGQGTGSAQNPPLTSHRPARPSLGPSGRSAVRVPPPQQLPSGSHGECTHVPTATGPTAAHAVRGGTARGWSMRTSRGRLRALGAEGRGWDAAGGVPDGGLPPGKGLSNQPVGSPAALYWVSLPRPPISRHSITLEHRNPRSHPKAVL